jgi:DNA-binding CsgD family transcriptional regulator
VDAIEQARLHAPAGTDPAPSQRRDGPLDEPLGIGLRLQCYASRLALSNMEHDGLDVRAAKQPGDRLRDGLDGPLPVDGHQEPACHAVNMTRPRRVVFRGDYGDGPPRSFYGAKAIRYHGAEGDTLRRQRPATRTLSRLLLRPYALAHRREGFLLAGACILALLLVFIADVVTPRQVALSALGLIPLLAAMWLLSDALALVVGAIALTQLVVTGVLGTLSLPTVASEGAAYVVLAVVCRLYAGSLAEVLLARTGRATQPNGGPATPVTLTVGGRKAVTRGLESLTAREQQVARLAAQGYTAREIGIELHIGRRTVETHLVNAYDKLGVRSKRELMRSVRTLS